MNKQVHTHTITHHANDKYIELNIIRDESQDWRDNYNQMSVKVFRTNSESHTRLVDWLKDKPQAVAKKYSFFELKSDQSLTAILSGYIAPSVCQMADVTFFGLGVNEFFTQLFSE